MDGEVSNDLKNSIDYNSAENGITSSENGCNTSSHTTSFQPVLSKMEESNASSSDDYQSTVPANNTDLNTSSFDGSYISDSLINDSEAVSSCDNSSNISSHVLLESKDTTNVFEGREVSQLSVFEQEIFDIMRTFEDAFPDIHNLGNLIFEESCNSRKEHEEAEDLHITLQKLKTYMLKLSEKWKLQSEECNELEEKVSHLEEELDDRDYEFKKLTEFHHLEEERCKQRTEDLKNNYESKIAELKKRCEVLNAEKEVYVVRYATNEKELQKLRKEREALEKKVKEKEQYLDKETKKIQKLTDDNAAINILLNAKKSELSLALSSLEKLKEELRCKDIQTKWTEQKFQNEIMQLKTNEENMKKELSESQLEIEQLKRDLEELRLNKYEAEDTDVACQRCANLIEENNILSLKVQKLETDRLSFENLITQLKNDCNLQNQKLAELQEKSAELESVQLQLKQNEEKVFLLHAEVNRLNDVNKDLLQEMESCRMHEAELLDFTQKLTAKNVALQSESSTLEAKKTQLENETAPLKAEISKLSSTVCELKKKLESEKEQRDLDTASLSEKLAEKTKLIDKLLAQVEDQQAEIQGLRSKYSNSVRELTKELNNVKKQQCNGNQIPEGVDGSSTGSGSGDSICFDSRTSSCTSLNDTVQPACRPVEPDKQSLIEKILVLQRKNAKYAEKVEFFEEHVAQLLTEIKKKTRIIQHYMLREQTGALTSEAMEQNKAEMVKYGGVMSLLYVSNGALGKASEENNNGITLELSLEINRKMQALLEDTVLKNITLKENLETLGQEVERLTKQS